MVPPVVVKAPVGELVMLANVGSFGLSPLVLFFFMINPWNIGIAEINVVLHQHEVVVHEDTSHPDCFRGVFIFNVIL